MTEIKPFTFENGYSDWLRKVKPLDKIDFLDRCDLGELFGVIEEYFEGLKQTKKIAIEYPDRVIEKLDAMGQSTENDRVIKKIRIEDVKEWVTAPTIPGLAAALEISRQGLEKFLESSVEDDKVKMILAAIRYIEAWTVEQGMKGGVRGEFAMFTMKNLHKYKEETVKKEETSTSHTMKIEIVMPNSLPKTIGAEQVIDASETKTAHSEEEGLD